MPNWKKLLSSGSSGSLSNLIVDHTVDATVVSGSIHATGHIVPSANNTYDLGSTTKQFRDLYLSSASLYIDGTQVLSSDSNTLTFTTDTGQSIKLLETGADDITFQTDTGNIELKGTVELLSGKKITDSAGNVVRFGNAIGVTGSIETTGTVDGIDLQAFSASVASGLGDTTLSSSAHTQRVALNSAQTTANNTLSSSIATALRAEYVAADTALSSSQKTYIDQKVAGVVDSAPATLDTLNELAAALNDDPNFSASIATSIGNRVLTSTFNTYSGSAAGALRTEYKAGDSALSSSAHTQRVAIASSIPTNNNQLTNGAGYITGHPSITAASSVNNTGRTYIQDITLDSNGHVTGIASATETVTNTDTNYYLDGITKSGNTLTFSVNGTTDQTYTFGSNAFTSTTIPTNNNQLTNGAGYITSFDITTQTDSKYLRSDTSDIMAGVLTLNSTNDNQLILTSANTWTGIGFDDGDAASTDYLWHYGATGTFALGGGGSSTTGKKLHVDGGVSIGANADAVTMPTNGLYVEGELQLGSAFKAGTNVSAGYYQDSSNGAYRAITTSGDVGYYFQTNAGGSTKMYVGLHGTYAGKVGIGNQTPSAVLDVQGSTAGETVFEVTGTNGTLFSVDDSLTGDLFTVADSSAVPIFSVNANGVVSVSGDLQVTGDVTAYYSSDERLKKNISPIDSPLEKLKLISGNTFEWDEENTAHNNKGKDIGVIAQEVEKVLPEIVGERKGYKAVQYEKIVALLIESNKALLSRVEELEAKIK